MQLQFYEYVQSPLNKCPAGPGLSCLVAGVSYEAGAMWMQRPDLAGV